MSSSFFATHVASGSPDTTTTVRPAAAGQLHFEQLTHPTCADLPVHTVDTGGADPDTNLARPWMRLIDVIESQHFGRAVPLESNCLHDSPSPRCAVTIRRLIANGHRVDEMRPAGSRWKFPFRHDQETAGSHGRLTPTGSNPLDEADPHPR
jgi:hypothetical protein